MTLITSTMLADIRSAGRKAAIASGPKPNCRYMNFAGNIERHGPIDCVTPRAPGKGTGEAPTKICPVDEADINGKFGCEEIVHASARECPNCHYQFTFIEKPKFTAKPTDVAILATVAEPEPRTVTSRNFYFHEGKGGKPPSVKVSYMVGMTAISEWLCPQHQGFPKSKADRYWLAHGGLRPFPRTVMEWLERQSELRDTVEISVKPRDRYWDVIGHVVGAANDNRQAAVNDNSRSKWEEDMDDFVPF